MKCINCGNEVQDGILTCPFCNANLTNQVPVTPTAPVLPQDQGMVVEHTAPIVNTTSEPIAEVVNNNVTPVSPVTPVTPNVSVPEPVTPVTPVMPETPVTPVSQNVVTPEPVQPVTPATPVAPSTPATPETPVAPSAPVTPETPAAPAAPVNPIGLDGNGTVPPVNDFNGEKIGTSAPVITKKNNKKRNIIILVIVLILLVIAGIGTFFYFYEFKSANKRVEVIAKNLFSFTSNIKNDKVELSSGSYKVNGSLTVGSDTTYSIDLDGTYGIDLSNEIIDLTLNANSLNLGEELLPSALNVELYINDSKLYVLLQNFFDKYIYVESDDIKEIFNNLSENDINYVTIVNGFKNATIKAVQSANIEQTIETVTINGTQEKVNVMRIKATTANQKTIANTFINALANNESFVAEIAKIADMTEDKVKSELTSSLDDVTFENKPKNMVEFYSPIIGNSFKGARIINGENNSVLEVYPIANGYGINATEDSQSTLKATYTNTTTKSSKTTDTTTVVSCTTFSDDTTYKFDLTLNVTEDVNPSVEKVNVKNSVEYQYLTSEDIQTITNNISNYGNLGLALSTYLGLYSYNDATDILDDDESVIDDFTTDDVTTDIDVTYDTTE